MDFLANRNEDLEKDWSHNKAPMDKHLKPDRDTNLNDPRSEAILDCFGLQWNKKSNFWTQNLDLDWLKGTQTYAVSFD